LIAPGHCLQAWEGLPALFAAKRAAWAPLQQLCDAEMLRLMAAAAHPPAVQPLVPRLFGGALGCCQELTFQQDGAITGVSAGSGFVLHFELAVYPAALGELPGRHGSWPLLACHADR
jgi:hypothetical protein